MGLPATQERCVSVPVPSRSTTYTLTAAGPGGTAQRQATLNVGPLNPIPPPPRRTPKILSFRARPNRVYLGPEFAQVDLCYEVTDATDAQIDRNVGRVPLPASPERCVSVTIPKRTTTYTLMAFAPGATVEAKVSVTVAPPPSSLPRILFLEAQPASAGPNSEFQSLCYGVVNSTRTEIDQGVGAVPVRTKNCVRVPVPRQTTTYTLTAFGPGGSAKAKVDLRVAPPPPPPARPAPRIVSFLARPDHVSLGAEFAQVNLCYVVADATDAQIDRVGRVPLPAAQARCVSVPAPSQTTTYTLRAFGPGGRAEARVSVTVAPPPPPGRRFPGAVITTVPAPISPLRILRFVAQPEGLSAGQTGRLCYGVTGAVRVRIEPGGNQVAPAAQNCVSIRPTQSTQYTLTATGVDGRSVSQSAVVRVAAPPRPR